MPPLTIYAWATRWQPKQFNLQKEWSQHLCLLEREDISIVLERVNASDLSAKVKVNIFVASDIAR
jgi:hypothetical protein